MRYIFVFVAFLLNVPAWSQDVYTIDSTLTHDIFEDQELYRIDCDGHKVTFASIYENLEATRSENSRQAKHIQRLKQQLTHNKSRVLAQEGTRKLSYGSSFATYDGDTLEVKLYCQSQENGIKGILIKIIDGQASGDYFSIHPDNYNFYQTTPAESASEPAYITVPLKPMQVVLKAGNIEKGNVIYAYLKAEASLHDKRDGYINIEGYFKVRVE